MLEEGILSGEYKRSGQHCGVETSCLLVSWQQTAWVRWRLIYKVGGVGQQPFCVNYHFVIWRLLDVFERSVIYTYCKSTVALTCTIATEM